MDIFQTTLINFAQHFPKYLWKGVEVFTQEELGTELLYHISENRNISWMTPNVSNKTLLKESRNIPRISVAGSVISCIIGQQAIVGDFIHDSYEQKKGGYWLYGIEFDKAVKPTPRLLPDVEKTDEYWLLPDYPQNIKYLAQQLARFFPSNMVKRQRSSSEGSIIDLDIYFEVFEGPIPWGGDQLLYKGYWKVSLKDWYFDDTHEELLKKSTVSSVRREEYLDAKGYQADLLSFKESPSLNW